MIQVDVKKNFITSQGPVRLHAAFEIADHELVSLAGPSGAGKTSVLKMIAGLMEPDEGFIQVHDEIWFDSKKRINKPAQERAIGFVFQDYNLFPNMTVEENLRYALREKGDEARINELLELMHLTELKNRVPQTLSGGQKQRVALIRAFLRKPQIFLLDEALSALDLSLRLKIQDEILALHQRFQVPSIFVTHDWSEVFKLAHRIIMLENGKITGQGSPGDILGKRALSGKFKFLGNVVGLEKEDVVSIVTIQIGHNLTKVIVTQQEAENLKIGDRVVVSAKAFNPILFKI